MTKKKLEKKLDEVLKYSLCIKEGKEIKLERNVSRTSELFSGDTFDGFDSQHIYENISK
jgi:hypothetical protein